MLCYPVQGTKSRVGHGPGVSEWDRARTLKEALLKVPITLLPVLPFASALAVTSSAARPPHLVIDGALAKSPPGDPQPAQPDAVYGFATRPAGRSYEFDRAKKATIALIGIQ